MFDFARKHHMKYSRGYITSKELRGLADMGDTASEINLSSQIFKRWSEQGNVKKVKKGVYRFVKPHGAFTEEALKKALVTLIGDTAQPILTNAPFLPSSTKSDQ